MFLNRTKRGNFVRLIDCDGCSYLDDEEATGAFFRDGFFYPGDMAVRRSDVSASKPMGAAEPANMRTSRSPNMSMTPAVAVTAMAACQGGTAAKAYRGAQCECCGEYSDGFGGHGCTPFRHISSTIPRSSALL